MDTNCVYKVGAIQYIIKEVLGQYFIKVMQNQKIKLDSIQTKNLYISINSHK